MHTWLYIGRLDNTLVKQQKLIPKTKALVVTPKTWLVIPSESNIFQCKNQTSGGMLPSWNLTWVVCADCLGNSLLIIILNCLF